MSRPALTLKAIGARIAAPPRCLRNRVWAARAGLGGDPIVAGTLPDPIAGGDADRGLALLRDVWRVRGVTVACAGPIWGAPLPDPAFEAERQAFGWLEDLAAFGTRPARSLAQGWTQDWIRRFARGAGPGWAPELAGRRARQWVSHAALLSQDLDEKSASRFWRALAAHQRYLARAWATAPEGLPRLHALTGLVWTGRVLPFEGQAEAVAALGALADGMVDAEGGALSRAPEDLAEILILLVWTARMLEDSNVQVAPAHLAAIGRAVPVLRPLRLGGGALPRFHGGGGGDPERLDQAMAELRLGVQTKPRLPMGFARLSGGRVTLVMDAAAPPAGAQAARAHASALAFEMTVGRQPLVINAGPGAAFSPEWSYIARQTAAHSTVEIDGQSSARFDSDGLAARTFGATLSGGPTFVSIRQAQDATGMWLVATHDGYVANCGLLHERRIFVDAKGREARGEEILSVTDARARAQFDKRSRTRPLRVAARFHLHPEVMALVDHGRQLVELTLPDGDHWVFRIGGGDLAIEDSACLDPAFMRPIPTRQVVVRTDVVEYLGQITWSFSRVEGAQP